MIDAGGYRGFAGASNGRCRFEQREERTAEEDNLLAGDDGAGSCAKLCDAGAGGCGSVKVFGLLVEKVGESRSVLARFFYLCALLVGGAQP